MHSLMHQLLSSCIRNYFSELIGAETAAILSFAAKKKHIA
jgi:hypothetical protein